MAEMYANGQTSFVDRWFLHDAAGVGISGMTFASSGLIISTIANNEATPTVYTAAGSTIETITTLGTWQAPTATKCRFKEVDATNHKGVYEFQFANTRLAVAGAKDLIVSWSGFSGLIADHVKIQLTVIDPYSIASLFTTLMSEAYAADGAGLTPANALLAIHQRLFDFQLIGTVGTAYKLDGVTAFATFTTDDAVLPKIIHRTA